MNWTTKEMNNLSLGDKRLNERCKKMLTSFGNRPGDSIPKACGGWTELSGAYRFLSNKKVTPEKVIGPHIKSTHERLSKHKVILCIQDTTEIVYSTHKAKQGIGPLNSAKHRGLLFHPTLAVTPNNISLGLLDDFTWHRDRIDKSSERHEKPIEEKESYRWLNSYRLCNELASEYPETQFINISDREGDIYELFLEGQEASVVVCYYYGCFY